MILSEKTLLSAYTGEDRFKLIAHAVSAREIAEAKAIVVVIDGRVEVLKSTNGVPVVAASVPPWEQIVIYPAQNGGFVVREKGADAGRIVEIIAACSDLTDLLEAVERYYQREAVVSGGVYLKDSDPDFAEVGEERTVTDGAAVAEEEIRHVVRTFDAEGNRTGGAVFYDGEVASAVVKLIRGTGADATSEKMPAY